MMARKTRERGDKTDGGGWAAGTVIDHITLYIEVKS